MELIDIHSHLADHYFDDNRDEVLARMQEAGVGTITIGVDLKTSEDAVACAEKNDNVWACVGVHPEDGETFDEKEFASFAQHEKVVAIGECGLDYFRTNDKDTARKRQLPEFEKQIAFGVEHELPLMLHVRPSKGTHDAYDDVLEVLESEARTAGARLKGNAHFYAGNVLQAKRFFDLGFTISFTGVITFASEYDEIVQMAPLNMLHAETDAPFVAPKPHRGKQNEPTYVTHVIERIAELKGKEVAEVQMQLRENCTQLFGI